MTRISRHRHQVLLTAIVLLLAITPAALASVPDHPDLAGTWYTTDCATWWEHGGPIDCSVWGDGSTVYLDIGPGNAPAVQLEDAYSSDCAASGQDPILRAKGKGEYVIDGIWLSFKRWGCGFMNRGEWTIGLYWDPSDEMWEDPDGDGWGRKWHRIP